ncbi:hypothetical protein AMECASPLE_003443 [Ameca splendens]|uniref:Uncharacterized protein n=1 Tax=Ameca splendens TaxID=208324 RepID=A0ABV0XYJ8_9TELE
MVSSKADKSELQERRIFVNWRAPKANSLPPRLRGSLRNLVRGGRGVRTMLPQFSSGWTVRNDGERKQEQATRSRERKPSHDHRDFAFHWTCVR